MSKAAGSSTVLSNRNRVTRRVSTHLGCLALLFALPALADVNLAATCKSGTSSGSQACTGGVVYDYPASGKWIRTTGDVFYFWGVLQATANVSVCTADVSPGSIICPAVALIPKSQVPLSPTTPPNTGTFKLQITWTLPTTGIQDGRPVTLSPGDVVGVQVAWRPDDGGRGAEIALPPTSTAYLLQIPAQKTCVSVSLQGKDTWSDSSPVKCIDPVAPSPIKPDAVFGLNLEIVP